MNAVPIESLPDLIALTVKGFTNGLVRLQKQGIVIDPQDTKLDLSFVVLAPNGLNAISRVTTNKTEGETTSTQVTPEIVETSVKGRESSEETVREGAKNSTENSTTTPNLLTVQVQDYGRQNELTLTYEE